MSRPLPQDVRRVTSIGGGPIGAGWAAHFLARGYDVAGYIHSRSEETTYRKMLDTGLDQSDGTRTGAGRIA